MSATAAMFDRLRTLELDVPLWRVSGSDLGPPSDDVLVIVDTLGLDAAVALAHVGRIASRHPTIALASGLDLELAFAYLHAGALGAIDPDTLDRSTLRRVLVGAVRGEPVFPRAVLGQWLRQSRRARDERIERVLTERQREVVTLIARGATDKDIAAALDISLAAAQRHVANVLRRLSAPTRAAAAAVAVRASLVSATKTPLARRPR